MFGLPMNFSPIVLTVICKCGASTSAAPYDTQQNFRYNVGKDVYRPSANAGNNC